MVAGELSSNDKCLFLPFSRFPTVVGVGSELVVGRRERVPLTGFAGDTPFVSGDSPLESGSAPPRRLLRRSLEAGGLWGEASAKYFLKTKFHF